MAKNPAIHLTTAREPELTGWQAQKSAMTCERILDAAIDCFINLGYANVTTAKVADVAGVSRGAMLHHFPSKTALIKSSVEHLHHRLIADYTLRLSKISRDMPFEERTEAGIRAYWSHLASDLFTAYHELCISGRTDPELRLILDQSVKSFDDEWAATNNALFPEWVDKGDRFALALDFTKFMMEGMAVGQIASNRDLRVNRLVTYLCDRLIEIFHGEGGHAIHHHSSIKN